MLTAAAVVVTGVVAGPILGTSAPALASGTYDVMSSSEKQSVLWDIMEDFVPRVEATWTTTSDIPQVEGYYVSNTFGVWQSRGEANIAAIYATLLTNSNQSTFGGIPRSQMEFRLTETIKHIAYQNNHAPGAQTKLWGDGAVVAGNGNAYVNPSTAEPFAWAAQLWWNNLNDNDDPDPESDEDTRALVELVVTAEANDILNDTHDPWPLGKLTNDTKLEDNAVAASLLSIAVAMFDSDPNADDWAEEAKLLTMNAWGRAADELDSDLVDGVPISDWVSKVNVYDDFTAQNHSFFHPTYMLSNPSPLVYYAHRSFTIPEAFQFRMAEVWDEVMAPLMSDDGDIVMPLGTDWVYHDFQHIGHLATIGTILGRDDAAVYESRAILQLRARQNSHVGGSLEGSLFGMVGTGYEADVVRVVANAWWVHELFGAAPEPTELEFETAQAAYDGVHQFPSQRLVFARNGGVINSMSWQDGGMTDPTGLVIPSSADYLDDPTLILPKTTSSLGSGTGSPPAYSFSSNGTGEFSTAAVVSSGARKFAYSAFSDGSAIVLDRGTGATFTYSFETTTGLTGARPVYDATGLRTGSTTLSGTWVNVADRFGLVGLGGGSLSVTLVAEDIEAKVNAHTVLTGATGTGNGNRAALILPGADRTETAGAAAFFDSSTISDVNWSAATGRGTDGTARIAVARWGGGGSATVTMLSPDGVPIPDRPNDVTVTGAGTGTTSFTLPSPGSAGHRGYFWVTSSNTVTVRPISETRVRLTNGAAASNVTVKYVDGAGVLHTASVALAANAVAYANAVDGGVAIVTPSASTTSGSFTPALAYDGNTSSANNWWSSSAGPTQDLILNFGKKVDIATVTMTPVASNGPRNYTVEVSTSASGCTTWSTPSGGTVTNASSSSATVSTFTTPQFAQCVRIRATSSWGSLVKIRELAITS
jgi:hypothetical protein